MFKVERVREAKQRGCKEEKEKEKMRESKEEDKKGEMDREE